MTLDENALIKLVALGDRNAFHQLYELHKNKVYNTALIYVKNISLAEEITQDVFVNVFKNASKFKSQSAISTWLYRIAINTSINYIKKEKRHFNLKEKLELQELDFDHPGVKLEHKESAKLLLNQVDILPESQKTAFILSFIEELPRKEVAEIMDTSLKAVESLLQRAKTNLRKELIKLYPNRRK